MLVAADAIEMTIIWKIISDEWNHFQIWQLSFLFEKFCWQPVGIFLKDFKEEDQNNGKFLAENLMNKPFLNS